jgi:hypothetical protein
VSVNKDIQERETRGLSLPASVTLIVEVEIWSERNAGGFISEPVGNEGTVRSEKRMEAAVWTVLAVGLDILEMGGWVEEGEDVQRGRRNTRWVRMRWREEWCERAGCRIEGGHGARRAEA